MKIAVLSDTHDNIRNVRKALELIAGQHVEAIIHCGDVI
ncbi:MAG: metallophosphoesterase family protein, partial [Desulfobacteraceae bacterium]|nr:metallophosphoesterase family protein [Desulfobacteraceae bacterium]